MKLAPEQWRSLSALLDQALTLPELERVSWVATLGAEHESFKALLREALERPATVETADLIGTLPAFSLPSAEEWAPGATVGAYRLVREVGRGGMGAVWLAERIDGLIKRPVALKLPILAASRQTLAERFAREREILSPLAHPNIARLYDAGFAADGQPYLALEYVEGDSITAYCDRDRLTVRARIELFLQILAAVQYAHANLVLHRDLKPSNILVTPQGEIKLLDFGIAKLIPEGLAHETALTRLAGPALTPDYAAPEQISGAPLTTASDVYSLGVVLYELLTGRRPYRLKRKTRAELEEAILAQDVSRPSSVVSEDEIASKRSTKAPKLAKQLAGDIDTIVLKALRKSPTDRYATAEAFAQDIERHLRGQPVTAQRDSAWYRASKFAARNKLALSAGAGIAIALVAGTSVALWQAHLARQETVRATASKEFVDQLFQTAARSNPGGAAAGDTTARQLLALGGRQLLEQSGAHPELQLDLLQWLARLNSELDLLEPASALSDRSIALATELHGGDSLPVAEALVQKADNLFRAASYVEATKVARDALRIADKQPAKTLELRAKAHLIIGNSDYQLDYTKSAEPQRELETALALLKQAHVTTEDRSRAAYSLAFIMEALREFAKADSYYLDGIAAGRENFGEKSFIVAFGYENLSDSLRQQQRLPEARESINKALAIYEFVLGPRHGTIAFAKTNLALIEAASGQRAEAERLLDQAVALAQEVFGEQARQVGFPAAYAARVKANRGELEAAARAYDRAIAVFARVDPPSSMSVRAQRAEAAGNLIALGQTARAKELLDLSQAAFDAANDSTSPPAARMKIARAELAYAMDDAQGGRAWLDRAQQQLATPSAAGNLVLPQLARAVARTQPSRERAQAMLDQLRTADLLPASPEELKVDIEDRARLAFAVGRLYLTVGQNDLARSWLTRAVALRVTIDVASSPWLAEAQVALAEVLLAAGQDSDARALLARAATIHAAIPGLGDAYRRPMHDAYALLRPAR
jgi:eukaryotic-like serine/threonine-protein kinase